MPYGISNEKHYRTELSGHGSSLRTAVHELTRSLSVQFRSLESVAANWTPLNQVQKSIAPGEWFLTEGTKKLAIIRLLKIGQQQEEMYRVVTFNDNPEERVLIGYLPHLRMAAEVTYKEWLNATHSEKLTI